MKKKIIVVSMCLTFVLNIDFVFAQEFDDAIPYFSNGILTEITGYSTFGDLVVSIVNGTTPEISGLWEKLIFLALSDMKYCFTSIGAILGFCILSSCINGVRLQTPRGTENVASLICYLVVSAFLLGVLKKAISIAVSTSDELVGFVKMSLPAYIGIIASTGINFMPSQAVFLAMINIVSNYAGDFMMNSFLYIGVLSILSNMSEHIRLSKLIGIFRQVMFWVLGFLLTLFAGLTTLSGINVAATSAGMRAVKYTIGRTIPLVGGFLADSAEVLMASAGIFKNAFGTGGIVLIGILCVVPMLKLFVVGALLKLTAGLSEPFCDYNLCNTIYQVGQTIIHIMVSLILITVMFAFSFSVLLICGGGVL